MATGRAKPEAMPKIYPNPLSQVNATPGHPASNGRPKYSLIYKIVREIANSDVKTLSASSLMFEYIVDAAKYNASLLESFDMTSKRSASTLAQRLATVPNYAQSKNFTLS